MPSVVERLVKDGLALHQAGRLDEADRLYKQALALDRRHPDALHLSGLLALQSGRAADAVSLLDEACTLQPRNWMFQANLASALLQTNQHDKALAAFRTAIKLHPDDPQLHIAAANCGALRGDFAGAEAQLRKVVRRFPGAGLAWFNLGNAVRDQGRFAEAVQLFTRAIQLDINNADAHNNLGSALHTLERFGEAEAQYRKAAALRPGDTMARCNLASVLIDAGKFDQAELACHEALKIDARSLAAHSALAAALSSQGRLIEALPAYRSAAALAPGDPRPLAALGSALFEAGSTEEGISLLERVVRVQPDSAPAHQGLAWAYLSTGNFEAGWREYYYRPRRERFIAKHAALALTTELPAHLAGKSVCLLREQGLGDELFFARFVRQLTARDAKVLYSADPRLAGMLHRSSLFESVVPNTEAVPPADFHLLVGDLPLALAAHEHSPAVACVAPPPLKLSPSLGAIEALKAKLAEAGPPPYIGVTWRAGIAPEQHRGVTWAFFKQVSLAELAETLRDAQGTVLVLQRRPRSGEIDELSRHLGRTAHDLSDLNDDLEAMLALLAQIDDYVGVSNTNMHMRAGLGKPARVLVPCPGEWRWLERDEHPVWFPDFRTYRQQNDGSWNSALGNLRQDLRSAYGGAPEPR